MCFTPHKSSLKLSWFCLVCNAVIIMDMVIDEQKHWRYSLNLLCEIREKMVWDKEMQLILASRFFSISGSIKDFWYCSSSLKQSFAILRLLTGWEHMDAQWIILGFLVFWWAPTVSWSCEKSRSPPAVYKWKHMW